MSIRIEIPVDEELLRALDELLAKRDELAFKLGVGTAEYERLKSFYLERIASLQRDEQRKAAEAIRAAGHDPNDGTWFRDGDKLVKK